MFEPELVRGSPTRTRGDRGLAGGLQHRAPAQLAEVSDAGRVRRERRRATGVSPHAGRFHRPDVGRFGRAGAPECYLMTGPKTGGRSKVLDHYQSVLNILDDLQSLLYPESSD